VIDSRRHEALRAVKSQPPNQLETRRHLRCSNQNIVPRSGRRHDGPRLKQSSHHLICSRTVRSAHLGKGTVFGASQEASFHCPGHSRKMMKIKPTIGPILLSVGHRDGFSAIGSLAVTRATQW
jgi:hypothetical protein